LNPADWRMFLAFEAQFDEKFTASTSYFCLNIIVFSLWFLILESILSHTRAAKMVLQGRAYILTWRHFPYKNIPLSCSLTSRQSPGNVQILEHRHSTPDEIIYLISPGWSGVIRDHPGGPGLCREWDRHFELLLSIKDIKGWRFVYSKLIHDFFIPSVTNVLQCHKHPL
jgi:hypothetical protein